jgi:hypothetical protein
MSWLGVVRSDLWSNRVLASRLLIEQPRTIRRRGPFGREVRYSLVSKSESTKHLHTYLNDHLAGSVSALELLDYLIERHEQDRFGKFFRDLRNEVQADQDTLRDLIRRLDVEESSVRKAGAWIAEKLGRAKIAAADVQDSYGLLQALEGLALGITGKKLLWRSLAKIASSATKLQGTDFARLEKRADEQIERVEVERLLTARAALSDREQT